MTETRQLAGGSLRFEAAAAASIVPHGATQTPQKTPQKTSQDPKAMKTDTDAHLVSEELPQRQYFGTWEQGFPSQ